jgi:hypothetical protein
MALSLIQCHFILLFLFFNEVVVVLFFAAVMVLSIILVAFFYINNIKCYIYGCCLSSFSYKSLGLSAYLL